MNLEELKKLTIRDASDLLRKHEVSSVELAKAYLDRISKVDKKTRAFITVTEKEALAAAAAADNKLAAGEKTSELCGVPCSVKDILCTKDIKTTAASNILGDYIPPYDATVVERLKAAGAVILGKTNCDAFAHGASTENSDFFVSRNPWDMTRIPGGSSGGSAAAVAAGLGVYSVGTETGGSIRQPASFCGTVGMKPTYGRSSRRGLISMASSLDTPGPITKTVWDTAAVLEVIAGHDKRDATSAKNLVPDYIEKLDPSPKGLKIGVAEELFPEGVNGDIKDRVREAINTLEQNGAEVLAVSLPHAKYASPAYAIICNSEISTNLSRFDGIKYGYSIVNDKTREDVAKDLFEVYTKSRKYGFGDEAKRRIMLGAYSLSSGYYDKYYKKASRVRTLIKEDWVKAFKKVDVVIGPTSPTVALRVGETKDNPIYAYLADELINPSSVSGLPGISIPCGFVKPGNGQKELPVGLQIIGQQFDEVRVLKTAYAFEYATDFNKRAGI